MDAPQPSGFADNVRESLHQLRYDRKRLLTVALIGVALATVGYFAVQPRPVASSPTGAGGPHANDEPATTATADLHVGSVSTPTSVRAAATAGSRVVVHVAGAVVRPGVVSLPLGARVVDAIDAVGGAVALGDVHQLDLAALLVDGTRIYVPRVGEKLVGTGISSGNTSAGGAAGHEDGASDPVNINTANAAELETLPGVGPSLAQAILDERERLGGFATVTDLKRVRGIGDRRFEQLQPLVTV